MPFNKIRSHSASLALVLFIFVCSAAFLGFTRVTELFTANRNAASCRETINLIYRVSAICSDADVAQIRYLATHADYDRALLDRAKLAAYRDIGLLKLTGIGSDKDLAVELEAEFRRRMANERVIGENCADFLESRAKQYTIVAALLDAANNRVLDATTGRDHLLFQLAILLAMVTLITICAVGIIVGYGLAEERRDAGLASFMGSINKPEAA